jgi:hypothetical protein
MIKYIDGVGEVEMTDEEILAFEESNSVISSSYVLPIDLLWMRMTDEEAEEFDAAISAAPLRQRKAFNVATTLTYGSELFLFVRSLLVTIAGEVRADVIMAEPSYLTSEEEEV